MKELTHESSVGDKLRAVINAAEHAHANETQFIARDDQERVLAIALYIEGSGARELERWLKRRDKRIEKGA